MLSTVLGDMFMFIFIIYLYYVCILIITWRGKYPPPHFENKKARAQKVYGARSQINSMTKMTTTSFLIVISVLEDHRDIVY